MLTITALRNNQFETIQDNSHIRALIAEPTTLVWLDIEMEQPSDRDILHTAFDFHPLALEDVESQHQRPKIDVYGNHYFAVFYAARPGKGDDLVDLVEIDIFIGKNYVVTVHNQPIQEIADAMQRWKRNVGAVGTDVGALLYAVMDGIVDEYFPLIDELAERVETLEERIFEKFDRGALAEIFQLKKDLLAFRRVVAPERDVFNVLLRRDPPILPQDSVIYFQDVYDHTVRVLDSIDTYRDLLSSALDAYLSVQSNNLNEVMRRLTVISTIFLPLTFLTGFFGMNFDGLPFHNPLALISAMAIMVLTPVTMYAWFRYRGLS